MTQTKFVRMKMTTYRRIRGLYPALRGESASHYFERLSKWLEKVMAEWDGFDDD